MRFLVTILIVAGCFCLNAKGQLVCLNAQSADTTTYSNGMPNDSVYFVCAGQNATVVATPALGEPVNDFRWYYFSVGLNDWVFADEDLGVASSTRNLPNGGFKVEIIDVSGLTTESYICWVCRIFAPPIVNANTIPSGCTSVLLSGLYFAPQITSYYNPPSLQTEDPLPVTSSTGISVCFEANHSFVSDLSFHLIGPASCGSPHAILSSAPFELQEDTLCNYGSDVTALCFSNASNENLDVCDGAPFTLTGNFGSYGSEAIPIDWDIFIGCNANEEDWSVQVYDCVGGDVGELTATTITFSGLNWLGDDYNVVYATPENFFSNIPDDVCSLDTLQQVTIPREEPLASIIPIQFSTLWRADPPFDIPNPVNDFNIILDPGPTVDTQFYLELVGPNVEGACGGNTSDVEFYDYIAPEQSDIAIEDNVLCSTDASIVLSSDVAEGTWSGPGIVDPIEGIFSPAEAGNGVWNIEFIPVSSCIQGDTEQIIVTSAPVIEIDAVQAICSNEMPQTLNVSPAGGLWSGSGITNAVGGMFNPSLVEDIYTEITYEVGGECPASSSVIIEVVEFNELFVSVADDHLCLTDEPVFLNSNLSGGSWTGPGINGLEGFEFDPLLAGVGAWELVYSYDEVCSDQTSITIEVDDPQISVTPVSPICLDGASLNLTASPVGGVWSGNGITNQLTGVFNPNAIGQAGSYLVYYTIDNACNPVDSIIVVLEDYPSLEFNIPAGICPEAAPVELDANIPGGVWTGNAVTEDIYFYFDPALGATGMNEITYFVDGVCDVQTSTEIEIFQSPTITTVSDTSVCYDGNAALWASGALSYTWQPEAGLNQTSGSSVLASPSQTTAYIVTGYSNNGCASEEEVLVTIFSQPDVIVNGPFAICEEEDIQLLASGLESYVWSGGGLNYYDVANPLASPEQTTTYSVGGFDENGCYGENTLAVEVISPAASFTSNAYTGVSPFTPEIINTSTGDIFYWDFGNGDTVISNDVDEIFSPEFSGAQYYTVTLTAVIGDCASTYSFAFNSYYDSEILILPNIVTMDGNGKNDYFRIASRNLESLEVEIFDRWGIKIGGYIGPDNQWSPREFGSGNYYYTYNAVGLDGEEYRGSGEFMVKSSD